MADPFASGTASRGKHTALAQQYKLPVDVYYPLVEGFLQDERYVKWSGGYKPWQLHCHGAPGCGKTTFAAIVANKLRERYKDTAVRVASIFVRNDVQDDHASFVEDFLVGVYSQLSPQASRRYETACQDGRASTERIRVIREALHEQLLANEHNLLILDGYDSLDAASRLLMDHEMDYSHLHNLSLLITRRNPLYRPPEDWNVGCDICRQEGLLLYWECQTCGDDGPQFCYRCKEAGLVTTEFEHDHDLSLVEPYDHIDLDISKPGMSKRSSTTEEHISPLKGFVMRQLQGNGQYSDELARSITRRAGGNINMAKLRLDELQSQDTIADGNKVRDRLPRGIIAFFDSEIERIVTQMPALSDLGLMSIVAVAEHEEYDARGMHINDLEKWTQDEKTTSSHGSTNPLGSIEDILVAANGLLTLQPYNDAIRVACFHQQLAYYVRENYSETLYLAKEKLDQKKGGMASPKAGHGSWDIARLVSSPPSASEPFKPPGASDSRSSSHDSAYYSGNTSRETTMSSTSGQVSNNSGLFEDVYTPLASHVHRGLAISSEIPTDTTAALKHGGLINPGSLCSLCEKQILGSNDSRGNHHLTTQSLKRVVTSYCVFCSDLYQDILLPEKNSLPVTNSSRWPRYSWAIRSTGKTRNSKQSFVVIFTPNTDNSDDPRFSPPRREYHILAEEDIGYIPTPNFLGTSTDPHISGGVQLRSWIKTCTETHPNCNKPKPENFVPTRLVDLQCEDQSMVRIVDSKANNINAPYLTLSHSWGPPTFLQLVKGNQEQLMGPGVKLTELTKNFQEAISVARFIGLRYIWIDSICIMQGEGGDFASEGQLMHKVYRYAFCNIAIADSENSKGGLFRPRDVEASIPACYQSDGLGKLEEGSWRILRGDFWKENLLGTKIYTRGWVFQERMLAPRILHFAAHQIFWDCSTLSACESLPHGLPHALDGIASTDRHWRGRMQITSASESQIHLVGANNDSMETFWRSALLNYTSCNLTNQTDKTFAIWSIAKLVRDALDEEYGAGLWENALEEQLAWRVREVASSARVPELQSLIPSWSWASLKGSIIAHERLPLPRCYQVTDHVGEPISFQIMPYKTKDLEPKLSRRSIKMSGYIGHGILASESNGLSLKITDNDGSDRHQSGSSTFEVFLDESLPEDYRAQNYFRFIVLAASEENPFGIGRQTSVPNASAAVAPIIDVKATPTTYSGIAILLLPSHVYTAQQYRKYKSLLAEVVARSPDHLVPDPPYGQGKSLVGQTADIAKIVGALKGSRELVEKEGGKELCYRRIGAIEFRGVSDEIWNQISGSGRHNIWLE